MSPSDDFSPLIVEVLPLGEDRAWRLVQPLSWRDFDGHVHQVEAGFETDFASIPRGLRWLVKDDREAAFAAVFHDQHYRTSSVPRRWADDMFFHRLVDSGVTRRKAWLMWLAVRLFGWRAYHSGDS